MREYAVGDPRWKHEGHQYECDFLTEVVMQYLASPHGGEVAGQVNIFRLPPKGVAVCDREIC